MLSYAFQALNQETYEDVAVESFDEMYNLLAAILSKGIGLQLKQGLYREYISRQEELSVMRGKINMPGTIKNRLAHKRVLTCDFDELSENNLLNQILKTTVTLLLRNGKVQAKYKDDLKKKMLYFSNVEIIEPTGIKWSSIRFQRNNQTYRMLVSICQLIIEGMLITTDSGDYRLASFVDEQGKIVKSDVSVAKNYLSEQEMRSLERIVSAYLDLAEDRAERYIPMTMEDWAKRLDLFLMADDREVLQDAGKITAEIAKAKAETEFEKYRVIQDRLFMSDFDKYMLELEENAKK